MARSAALNPSSTPFFPAVARVTDDDTSPVPTFSHHLYRDPDRLSTLSTSPSDYRSVTSSPSPLQDSRSPQYYPSPNPRDIPGSSPNFRQLDAPKTYPQVELRHPRETSMVGSLDTLPEADDALETNTYHTSHLTLAPTLSIRPADKRPDPSPVHQHSNGSSLFQGGFSAASPVSSLDSSSHITAQTDTFEAQLKASPFIQEMLERIRRCEQNSREIQHALGEMDRKVNLLVERALSTNQQHQAPEFKDPFSLPNGQNFNGHTNAPRPSLGNIAPNQSLPIDDISAISQRLNTLTSSVGQLLALQTQQFQVAELRNNSIAGLPVTSDVPPTQAPVIPISGNLMGQIPNRIDLRPSPRPTQPRTWSAGNLDIGPMRQVEQSIMRQDIAPRDKRRSVAGLLRRESSGMLDTQGGDYGTVNNGGGGSQRESGPIVTKWEQLSLHPDLLRSLGKFGLGPPNKIQQRALPFLLRGADIIAQAPPTQERIAAYVIPAIQIAVTSISSRPQRGPSVIMVSTTVDQATQAQRMIRDLGGPIGIRSALGVGTSISNNDLAQELRLLQQNIPHIICGTPQKLHALFTSPGGLSGSEVRFLVLDEVDQLIARNLHDFVFNIVKLLPPPRSRPAAPPGGGTANMAPGQPSFNNTFDTNSNNPLSPASAGAISGNGPNTFSGNQGRRFSTVTSLISSAEATNPTTGQPIERQTALFSNTVPQDVLNLATAIQLREPVRVLVRRDGNVTSTEGNQGGSRGLRQFYLYLAFTAGGGRADINGTTTTAGASGGNVAHGIIGSGRGIGGSPESAQAREWKLDALADIFDDVEVSQAVVHVGGVVALDAVVYKLASRGFDAIPLHNDMSPNTKTSSLNKFRSATPVQGRFPTKVLVVYDVQVKAPDILHAPLVINYDLPKAVEEYAHRVAPAVAPNYARAGVVINFVTATGGDVEMLRSIECFYKIKCPEVPMSLRDLF